MLSVFSCWVQLVARSCPTLYDPMDCSIPDFPVHHQIPEPTQTHVRCVTDAIQPSHPLSPSSPLAFNLSQHQGFFSSELAVHLRQPKYWSFSFSISPSNEYSGLISFRIDWFASPRDSQESSPVPQFKSIDSSGAKFSNHEFPQGSPWSVAK